MMASSPSELSLDCKPHTSYSMMLLKDHQTDHTQKLQEFLARLEEEKLKIDAFKRELPLCMELLTNAMEASRQQLETCQANLNQGPARPVLEEFIPLKHSSSNQYSSEKESWMRTAQLWSQGSNETKQLQSSTNITVPSTEIGFNVVGPKLSLERNGGGGGGGAFLPFSKERKNSSCSPSPTILGAVSADLALANSNEMEDINKCSSEVCNNNIGSSCSRRENSGKPAAGTTNIIEEGQGQGQAGVVPVNTQTTTSTSQRKARRCWSPELHRRFVSALQILGGSQVATPKQIRELMKVDGLTNDEVKSHLQKYRLHTRRPIPGPQVAGTPTPQLVVLGGIWVPPEYATAAAAHGSAPPPALYGTTTHPTTTHASPHHHYCTAPPLHQDFYHGPPQPQVHHNQLIQHQLHMYKASSQTHGSPESDFKGDQSESIEEDDKSESNNSWKGDSSEGGGERKGLPTLRGEGEDQSNGNEISLHF